MQSAVEGAKSPMLFILHSQQQHSLRHVSPSAAHGVQVRIISLDPEDTMKVLGVQAVQSTPESLLLLDSPLVGASGTEEGRGVGALFLHIGQQLPHGTSHN